MILDKYLTSIFWKMSEIYGKHGMYVTISLICVVKLY